MEKKKNCSHNVVESYHGSVNALFENYGSFVARRPLIPLLLGFILLGSLCFGLFCVKKETDLEKLWVEQNSRVAKEKKYFDQQFGGIPRLEAVTITSRNSTKNSADDKLDIKHAMDALKAAVSPLYEHVGLKKVLNNKTYKLHEVDFCERPLVPDNLKPGANPLKHHNYLAWGYTKLVNCALQAASFTSNFSVPDNAWLPNGWGIEWLPCIQVSPLDCFKEGGDFNYPSSLRKLERKVGPNALVDYTLFADESCREEVRSNFSSLFPGNSSASIINELVYGVGNLSQLFYTWGYRWRKSYADMTNNQIVNHINEALQNGRSEDPNPANPQIVSCVLQNKPCCTTWFGLPSPILSALGSVEFDSSNTNITKIGAIRWTGNNFHHNHPAWKSYINNLLSTNLSSSDGEALTKQFESHLIHKLDYLRQRQKNSSFGEGERYGDLQLEFNLWRSSEDIIADANKTPIWQIVLSVVLVSVYVFLAFVNFWDPVYSHTWLALTGLSVVTLAVVGGFGLSALCGIPLTPLAGSVVPFLALGLGVDDVFVLVNILRNYLKDPKIINSNPIPEEEMRLTVALAGPSVVLTTFSVLAAFFISSVSPMPVVRWFCWQMGITATLHTCGMILIFMPIMAIDARRVKVSICDPYLWLFSGMRKKICSEGVSIEKTKVSSPRKGINFQGHVGSTSLSKFVAKYYSPLFESNTFKIAMVLLFTAFLTGMSYLGFVKVERGLRLSDVTLKGSYQNAFAVITEDKFPSYQIYYVTKGIDYPTEQEKILHIYQTLQANLSYWMPPQPRILEASPLENLILFASLEGLPLLSVNVSGQQLSILPSNIFYKVRQEWSSTPLGALSQPDYSCANNITKREVSCSTAKDYDPTLVIGSTKTSLILQHLGAGTKENLEMIKTTRKIADKMNADIGQEVGFMYGYPFLFFEQYLHSFRDLYMVVGLALAGVFLAVLVFQFSLVVSIIIAIILLMVDLEVYGFMYLIGAKLNALSLVNLGIVIGMAAELTYLARSFLVVEGSKNYRIGKALEWTLEPLLHGFGTQVAATLPLLFMRYHAFKVYYFAMFTIMGVVGFLNGFILLPIFLSWFGPPTLPHIRALHTQRKNLAYDVQDKGKDGEISHGDQYSDSRSHINPTFDVESVETQTKYIVHGKPDGAEICQGDEYSDSRSPINPKFDVASVDFDKDGL